MRILPNFTKNIHIKNRPNNSKTQLKGMNTIPSNAPHKYTGNVSADLAYASMIDEAIAKDLKSMNLIG